MRSAAQARTLGDPYPDGGRHDGKPMSNTSGPLGSEEAWYTERFRVEPTYDRLLDQVTGFKVERAQLLASYIEPTADERAEGTKVPQEAHRAIARLVRDVYIRVIITTNFDQLLEEALRAESVVPRVVSTPEALEQALPLAQERCTIIKVHGDYTSGELKNTTEELADCDARFNRLLERVFGDFGLIICGWSADWDRALRAVIKENSSRAYSTFWAARGQLGDEATSVLNSRRGKALINIDDADSFFQVLEEKVTSIREVLNSETLTAEVARATLDRYLARPNENRILIYNLVTSESNKALSWLESHIVPYSSESWEPVEDPARQPHEYVRNGTAKLLTLFRPVTGEVRATGVTTAPNTVLHPWLQGEVTEMLAGLATVTTPEQERPEAAQWKTWLGHEPRAPLPPLRMILIWDNLAGHLSCSIVSWLFAHGVMPLHTPLSGSWLNLAEAVQRIIVRRALAGQHPQTPEEIIT